jgi:hypothetical protein
MRKQILLIFLIFTVLSLDAQIQKLAGPRIGMTVVTPGLTANVLRKDVRLFSDENTEQWTGSLGKYGAVTTQYGWQWESRFADGEKIVGIVEWIALVGGIEKGFFLPSISSMVGVRTDKGFEFAAGPNISFGGVAMVIGAGYNFRFGDLNIPVNIAFVPSMNRTYTHEAVYDYTHMYDDEGNPLQPVLESEEYTVTHPTGSRISLMVGFNLNR